ncbi:MAG: hypothetical protein LBG82_01050 [Clostridiales Family XIII bacterium]|jgi:hypothetical protein|nr:hypothetical protein [Clostridiales Family XIII bacterium]
MASKKNGQSNIGQVIIPVAHPNPPEAHEVEAARVLALHFGCEVKFLIPVDDYKRKTPDIAMLGLEWEIKSPRGSSKRSTIRSQFANAKGKSKHLIIDGQNTPLDDGFVINKLHAEIRKRQSVKKLIYITKERKVLDIR